MGETDLAKLLLPERLVLRFDDRGRMKNWHTYRSAVETLVLLNGLEAHLCEAAPPLGSDEKERAGWEADDKLCVAMIMLNMGEGLPLWLARVCEEPRPAALLWMEITGRNRGIRAAREGGARANLSDSEELFVKSLIVFWSVSFVVLGAIAVIRSSPSSLV